MNSEGYKRSLIRIYFDLLKKYNENGYYPELEEVKHNLEEELIRTKRQLKDQKKFLSELKIFLYHPIPFPPFLTKKLLLRLLNEIYEDLKSLALKIVLFVDTILMRIHIPTKRIVLFILLFALTCLLLSYLIVSVVKNNFHISIIILIILLVIYIAKKLKYIRYFCEQTIAVLETLCQQKENEIETLENQINASKIYNIFDLEDKVKIWLEEDKKRLIKDGMKRLNIKDCDNNENEERYSEQLDTEPILSLIGINSNESSESYILISDRELEKVKSKNQKLLIDEKDFYEEKGIDGRYRYGVYECFVIFLCETFLSYYRCYWNFVKGASVDEETCEYLYYSIVSVKTQERSSLRLKNPDEKRKYADLLSLTTMDGKIVYFKMSDDRKQKISANKRRSETYVSEINQAAERIRYWLRQRRVDYQMTKDVEK
jgi:Ca2+/Na+ antiporter